MNASVQRAWRSESKDSHPALRLGWLPLAIIYVAVPGWLIASDHTSDMQEHGFAIGHETAILSHLADGEERSMPLIAVLNHGRLLFGAIWTDQDGGGRP